MVSIATLDERKWQAATLLTTVLVKNAPKDKWNLALNGIRIVQDDGEYIVVIGGEVAPYAKYTNEDWDEFEAPLKGKENPHKYWIQDAIKEVMPYIKCIFSANYSEADIKSVIDAYNKDIKNQYANKNTDLEIKMKEIEDGKR